MKKYEVWRKVAACLSAKGVRFSADALEKKMRNLKYRY
jgi:hypothetical protein